MAEQKRISDFMLERYALGELSALEQCELQQALDANPFAQARLAEISRSNQEILSAYPPETVIPRIQKRAALKSRRGLTPYRFALWMPAGAALAAVLALVVLNRPPNDPLRPLPIETTRVKGLRPHLLIFAKPDAKTPATALPVGAVVLAHTLLQIAYVSAGRPFGVVVSIDGRGTATLHHPAAVSQSAQLQTGGQVLLPSAYELDDAPHFERFFFVTGATPIDVAAVLAAARQLAADTTRARTVALLLPAGLEQTSLLLRKERARDASP